MLKKGAKVLKKGAELLEKGAKLLKNGAKLLKMCLNSLDPKFSQIKKILI